MDFLRKAKDRVEQTVGEQVGSTPKTEYDAEFLAQLSKVDDIKSQTEKLLNAFEVNDIFFNESNFLLSPIFSRTFSRMRPLVSCPE